MSILNNSYPQITVNPPFGFIPSEEECVKLWDKYGMLPNIREHSRLVAEFARALAVMVSQKQGYSQEYSEEYIKAAYTAGLLHDIAKTWTIRNGGSHQQIGASMVRWETENPLLAARVYHHVIWPWQEGVLGLKNQVFHLPLIIAYSDKRVRHTELVTLEERFDDLFARYGKTEDIRKNIQLNLEQARETEIILAQTLEFNLYACTLVGGSLVA